MEDRRTLRSLTAAAALVGAMFCAACASSPDTESGAADDGGVPLPSAVLSPPDGAGMSGGAEADAAATDASGTGDAGAGDAGTDDAGTGADVADSGTNATPGAPTEAPRWFPAAGTVVRLAGLAPADNSHLFEQRTVTATDDGNLAMAVVIRGATDTDEDIARERYIVTVGDEDIRIALAPDALRAIPAAARELPRRPVKGAKWRTPSGECEVEAVGEDVVTFKGTRSGCVRVRLTTRTGSHSTRWFDPELGEIRREVRDRRGKLIAAWALCGTADPAADLYESVLLGE